MFVLPICLLLLAVSVHGSPDATKRFTQIVNGFEVNITTVPYQVALFVNTSDIDLFHCGGSIISKSRILTAAHCVRDVPENCISVRVGSRYKNDGIMVDVKSVIIHPKHIVTSYAYDFALLNLREPLKFSENVSPVKLPKQDEMFPDETNCMVSGWGDTDNNKNGSKSLRATIIPLVNQGKCSQLPLFNETQVSDSMICAGYLNKAANSCYGDSGGPLRCKNKLVGVVSWRVPKLCTADGPSVFGRVSKVVKWITATV